MERFYGRMSQRKEYTRTNHSFLSSIRFRVVGGHLYISDLSLLPVLFAVPVCVSLRRLEFNCGLITPR